MTSVKSKLFAVKKTRRIGVDAARWSRQPMGEATAEGCCITYFTKINKGGVGMVLLFLILLLKISFEK